MATVAQAIGPAHLLLAPRSLATLLAGPRAQSLSVVLAIGSRSHSASFSPFQTRSPLSPRLGDALLRCRCRFSPHLMEVPAREGLPGLSLQSQHPALVRAQPVLVRWLPSPGRGLQAGSPGHVLGVRSPGWSLR